MFKNSLFRKLIVTYLILITVSLGLLSLTAIEIFSQSYREEVRQHLENTAYTVRALIKDCPSDTVSLNRRITELDKNIHTRITVIDQAGRVLAESEHDTTTMENHNDRPEVISARTKGRGENIRYSHTLLMDMLYVALPLDSGKPDDIIIRVALPLKQMSHITNRVYQTVGLTFLLALVIALLMGIWLVRRIVRPVRAMAAAADRISRGDFSQPVTVTSQDEIGALAKSINQMSDQLQQRFSEITRQRATLDIVLASIHEGIIALNSQQKVLFVNNTAAELLDFDINNTAGKYLYEIIRHTQFINFVKEYLDNPPADLVSRDILSPVARQLRVYCAPIKGISDSFVIVVYDITESVKYEQLRRDFVANASHELRTPLSVIKGYVETLKEGSADPQKNPEFLAIIDRNVTQLNNLVADLLELSRLEYRKGLAQIQPVHIREIINPVVEDFTPAAALKNQTIAKNIPEQLPAFPADPELLKKALANLLDNAVKYTPSGGRIEIMVQTENNRLTIAVRDNGLGIPAEDLPRIFERFYRVDKSRSREMGGTGLGLAIAKHIVQLHQGEIAVQSRPGAGSTFTITLPL